MYTGMLKLFAITPIWKEPSLLKMPPVSTTASAPITT